MDEVDILLHPLKSELNFPMGRKEAIDLAGYRWDLPIHLLDALFLCKTSHEASFFEVNYFNRLKTNHLNLGVQTCRTEIRDQCFRGAFNSS